MSSSLHWSNEQPPKTCLAMSKADEFRARAKQADECAKQVRDVEARRILEEVARQWRGWPNKRSGRAGRDRQRLDSIKRSPARRTGPWNYEPAAH
jgi:hypothetical protein